MSETDNTTEISQPSYTNPTVASITSTESEKSLEKKLLVQGPAVRLHAASFLQDKTNSSCGSPGKRPFATKVRSPEHGCLRSLACPLACFAVPPRWDRLDGLLALWIRLELVNSEKKSQSITVAEARRMKSQVKSAFAFDSSQ